MKSMGESSDEIMSPESVFRGWAAQRGAVVRMREASNVIIVMFFV